MEGSLWLAVGRKRHGERYKRREEIRRSGQQQPAMSDRLCTDLRVDFGHAESVDHRRDERSDSSCSGLCDLNQGKEPEFVV